MDQENKEKASACLPGTTPEDFSTFRRRDVCWVSSMTSHAYVQRASETLVLHDCGRVFLYAFFMVILPTERQQAPFHIFPAALAHKAGMDSWRKSSRRNTSHTERLHENLSLLPGCVAAQHDFPACCCTHHRAQVSAAGWVCLQLQCKCRQKIKIKKISIVVIAGWGKEKKNKSRAILSLL